MPPESHTSRSKHSGAELFILTFKIQLFRKLNLVFVFIIVVSLCVRLSESSETKKSLFDSLPLNGAFTLDEPENVEVQIPHASVPSIKTDDLYEELTEFTKKVSSSDNKTDSGSSLFDLLPNQGALMTSSQTATHKGGSISQGTSKTSNDTLNQQNSRTQRHSNSLYSLQPSAILRKLFKNRHFKIGKQIPRSEFNVSVFDSSNLPPRVKSLTAQTEITVPRVKYGRPASTHRAIPIVQSSLNHGSQRFTGGRYSHYKKPSVGATSTSGAQSTSTKGQNQNQNEHGPPFPTHFLPSGTPYGVPATRAPVLVSTTVAPGPKNEIHHHYHISNNNKEHKSEQPSESYGTPPGPPIPPRRRYGFPGRRRRPRPNLRRRCWGKQLNQNGCRKYNPSPKAPTSTSAPSGGYDNSPKIASLTEEDFRTTSHDDRTRNEASQNNTKNSRDEGSQNREENFKQRTLQTYRKYPEQPQPLTSYIVPPSTSYGPPPPLSHSTYGQPEQTTRPPAPQKVNDQNPSAQNAHTSITLETIPITTTETRLVTVPKITQTVGSTQNIPTLSDTPVQPPPSSAYGAPYSRAKSFSDGPPAPPSAHQDTRNILNEQLLQLSPSRGGLPDFLEIEDLDLLQNQNSQRSTNSLLSSLLLEQLSNSNSKSQFSSGRAGDLFLSSSSPLRHQSQISLGNLISSVSPGGISVNNLPVFATRTRNDFAESGRGGLSHLSSSLRGGSTILTGDAIGAISDLIREQKLHLAVSELQSRLKHQNRDAERNRQSYRSLFYKGALLLAGLSLIPAVATVASPLAAGAGLGLASSSLLPLTAGRRKRSLNNHNENDNVFSPLSDTHMDTVIMDRNQYGELSAKNYPLVVKAKRKLQTHTVSLVYRNVKDSSGRSSGSMSSNYSDYVFDFMAFKETLIPEKIRADLEKYVPPSQVIANSECIQRYFCSTLLEIEALPDPSSSSFLLLFAALTSDIDKNPWLEHALVAAKKRRCTSFTCRVSHHN